MKAVPYVDMAAQFAAERDTLMPLVESVLAGGMWVGGDAVPAFEDAAVAYTGAKHCVGVSSGTDALILSLLALDIGPGDEVITPPNSFVASTAAIVHVGATPVFADVAADQNFDPAAVAAAVTPRTRAIMPVHLTGRLCDMAGILAVARDHGLKVIEDAAQAIGAHIDGRQAGTFGDAGCFSAHPLKNLNAAGDAGFVLTDDDALADRLRRLRNNGLVDRDTVVEWGFVSRLDSLQAVILSHRLGYLDTVIAARRANADRYRAGLDPAHVFVPEDAPNSFATYHTFVIQVDRRDALKEYLAGMGIGTAIHYPVPIHLQPAARSLGHGPGDFPVAERQAGRILSLPINQHLSADDIDRVIAAVNGFFQ